MKFLLFYLLALISCKTTDFKNNLNKNEKQKIVLVAKSYIGKSLQNIDNVLFIKTIFNKFKINFHKNNQITVKDIYLHVKKYGQITQNNPQVGDFVFFYQAKNNNQEEFMHVGLIETIQKNQITFINCFDNLVIRSFLNIKNKKINSILKISNLGKYLNAAELFIGFGKI